MVKIFRLITLALVMSVGGGVLSTPVAEDSTNDTTSDLDPDVHHSSTAKNIRVAEEEDTFDSHDSEERAPNNLHDELANFATPLLAKASSSKPPVGNFGSALAFFTTKNSATAEAAKHEVVEAMRVIKEMEGKDINSLLAKLYPKEIKPLAFGEALTQSAYGEGKAVELMNKYDSYSNFMDKEWKKLKAMIN